MNISKIPSWIIAVSLLLISVGFLVSLYALDEPRRFAGLEFGPNHKPHIYEATFSGVELPSNGGNRKTTNCTESSYMVGMRFTIDSGGPHGIISNVVPVCKTLEISIHQKPTK